MCFFLPFGGYISNPHVPSSSSYPLTLTPTILVSNSRMIFAHLKFFFHFLSWFLVQGQQQAHLAKCHPLGAPRRPPPSHISFSTSIQCLCSGSYHLMRSEIEFIAQRHPTFSRGHNAEFWPFWAIFANFAEFLYWFGPSHKLSEAGSCLTPPHNVTKLPPLTVGTYVGNLEHHYDILLKTILEHFVISLPLKMYPPTDNFGNVMTDGRWTLNTWCLLTISVKKHPKCR